MNQAEFILVAQQLTIAEDEGVALGLGCGGMGVKELGSHGSQCGRLEKRTGKDVGRSENNRRSDGEGQAFAGDEEINFADLLEEAEGLVAVEVFGHRHPGEAANFGQGPVGEIHVLEG